MTVGTKVHQTLASLRSAAGNLESFALETDNQQAKQLYHQTSQQVSQVVSQLESRVNTMEQQEPTYKISNSTQSGSQNSTGSYQSNIGSSQNTTSGTMMNTTNVTGRNTRTR